MALAVVQGVIAGGAISCLNRQDRTKTLESVIVHASHLLLLVGMGLKESQIALPYFSPFARSVFLITPVFLLADLTYREHRFKIMSQRSISDIRHPPSVPKSSPSPGALPHEPLPYTDFSSAGYVDCS